MARGLNQTNQLLCKTVCLIHALYLCDLYCPVTDTVMNKLKQTESLRATFHENVLFCIHCVRLYLHKDEHIVRQSVPEIALNVSDTAVRALYM